MISVSEARQLIATNCRRGGVIEIPLLEAAGSVLAETVYSEIESPPFDQSAMDGYAFSHNSWDRKSKLKLKGEVKAGSWYNETVQPFEAVRIFTGAPLPSGADTVVMQEKVTVENGYVKVNDDGLILGSNVRRRGSQIKIGEPALEAGQWLTPAGLSFLAGLGIHKVKVFAKPVISILVTGKELVKPGHPISGGEIYESNSLGITAALNQFHITPVSVEWVDDDEESTVRLIRQNLDADILILTGGVSVGDYDFVTSALKHCGVETIFHKVKQKPGKPFYFGKHNQTLIFGLPGNPASVMTCFYEYVVDAIGYFTGRNYSKDTFLPLGNDYKKKPGLTHFLKGKTKDGKVYTLPGQESYLMNSFALADCLIELIEDREIVKAGDMVPVRMLF